MRTPPLNTLRFFDAAARHLNFRLAAEELNLTQGAIAQQVRRLETELGVKLFQREARGLNLTSAGRIYSVSVRQSLEIIEDATQQLQTARDRITMSMPPSLASKWFVPRLKYFVENHPTIEVLTLASEALTDFKSDGVDLAIRIGKPPFPSNLQPTLLSLLDLCAVCSPDHNAIKTVIRDIRDFADKDLIHDGHDEWDKALVKAGIKAPERRMTFNHTALAMDAACSGRGIALVPRLLAGADIARGKLVQIWVQKQSGVNGFYIVSTTDGKTESLSQQDDRMAGITSREGGCLDSLT